jgi:hypothetical protein
MQCVPLSPASCAAAAVFTVASAGGATSVSARVGGSAPAQSSTLWGSSLSKWWPVAAQGARCTALLGAPFTVPTLDGRALVVRLTRADVG